MLKAYRSALLPMTFIFFRACSSNPVGNPLPANTLDHVKSSGILKVGTTGDYRPFTFLNTQGTYSGMDIKLAKNLALSLGVKLELVKTTWNTLSKDLIAGRFDLAMGGISTTEDRKKVGLLSVGYLTSGKAPIALCMNRKKYDSLEKIDQAKVRIIVNPGGSNENFVKTNLHQVNIIVYRANNTIFEQLLQKKADVMITDSTEIDLATHIYKKLCGTTGGKTFNQSNMSYYLPKDEAWKSYIDQWLTKLIQDHTVEKEYAEAIHEFSSAPPF